VSTGGELTSLSNEWIAHGTQTVTLPAESSVPPGDPTTTPGVYPILQAGVPTSLAIFTVKIFVLELCCGASAPLSTMLYAFGFKVLCPVDASCKWGGASHNLLIPDVFHELRLICE
jgi:hypothetical protein